MTPNRAGLGECEQWAIIGLQMNATDNDRRLRIQYPNALYRLTSRGVGRSAICLDDGYKGAFFDRMERTVNKFGWLTYAITLMTNHFHLYLRTP